MTIENLKEELERKEKLINELTDQNEHLYHQYNHLIIRNNKYVQRINELQQTISSLQEHIHELQKTNYQYLQRKDFQIQTSEAGSPGVSTILSPATFSPDLASVYERWKNYPGQQARNAPNIRKQVHLLFNLFESGPLKASDLFTKTGINGVTGARYVAILKKFNLIEYNGARKKGQYNITETGRQLLNVPTPLSANEGSAQPDKELQALNNNRINEFKSADTMNSKNQTTSNFDHFDL